MLDVKFVTENLDFVTRKLRERGAEVYLESFEKLTGLNAERKSLQTDVSTMRLDGWSSNCHWTVWSDDCRLAS